MCRTFRFLGKVDILYVVDGIFFAWKTSLEKGGEVGDALEGGFGQGLIETFHTPFSSSGNFSHESVLLIHKVTKLS